MDAKPHTQDDRDARATWEIEDGTTRAQVEAERARKRDSADRALGDMTLDQLHEAYQRMATADQRAGMHAMLIRYLERGR